jgi:GTP-binding protein Era
MTRTETSLTRCGDIALAGRPNVGKSSLLNALVGQHLALVSRRAQATRLPVVGVRTDPDTQYIFHDLPGLLVPSYLLQTRMLAAAQEALQRVDVTLYLTLASQAPARSLVDDAQLQKAPRGPIVNVYTKGDLVSRPTRVQLEDSGIVISTKEGWGLNRILTAVREHLPEGPFRLDPDDVGTQPLRFFATEFVREAAFEALGDELPYSLACEVEEFREEDRPMYIRITIVVERDSQKGMVVGRGGKMIKKIGSHARLRLEELAGVPVYLDLWVKVLKNWRRSPSALTRFGFPRADKETA